MSMNRRDFVRRSTAALASTPVLLGLPAAASLGAANVAATLTSAPGPTPILMMSDLLDACYPRHEDRTIAGTREWEAVYTTLTYSGPIIHDGYVYQPWVCLRSDSEYSNHIMSCPVRDKGWEDRGWPLAAETPVLMPPASPKPEAEVYADILARLAKKGIYPL